MSEAIIRVNFSSSEPPVPPHTNLGGSFFMKLSLVEALCGHLSTLPLDAFGAAIRLRIKAFTSIPAGSVPDDDRLLAAFSGAGDDWPRLRQNVLHGWIKCSDGRLYCPDLVPLILEDWKRRESDIEFIRAESERRQKELERLEKRRARDRERKARQRAKKRASGLASGAGGVSGACPMRVMSGGGVRADGVNQSSAGGSRGEYGYLTCPTFVPWDSGVTGVGQIGRPAGSSGLSRGRLEEKSGQFGWSSAWFVRPNAGAQAGYLFCPTLVPWDRGVTGVGHVTSHQVKSEVFQSFGRGSADAMAGFGGVGHVAQVSHVVPPLSHGTGVGHTPDDMTKSEHSQLVSSERDGSLTGFVPVGHVPHVSHGTGVGHIVAERSAKSAFSGSGPEQPALFSAFAEKPERPSKNPIDSTACDHSAGARGGKKGGTIGGDSKGEREESSVPTGTDAFSLRSKASCSAPSLRSGADDFSFQSKSSSARVRAREGQEDLLSTVRSLPEPITTTDPRTKLFREGLRTLMAMNGFEEAKCRALIGRWLKATGDDADAVHDAINEAAIKNVADPVSWITASLKARYSTPPSQGAKSGRPRAGATEAAEPGDAAPGTQGSGEAEKAVSGRQNGSTAYPDLGPVWTAYRDRPRPWFHKYAKLHPHRGQMRWAYGSFLADGSENEILAAAGLPWNWKGDMEPAARWLCEGWRLEVITRVIREIAERENYEPPRSLMFFDAAIRASRKKDTMF